MAFGAGEGRGKHLFFVGVGVGYHLGNFRVGPSRDGLEKFEIGFVGVVGFVGDLKVGDERSSLTGQSLLYLATLRVILTAFHR
jgi:hypothetical protein